MGLFDFLLGSKPQTSVQVAGDRIWISADAKVNGIQQQLRQRQDSVAILLIAHFEEALEPLNQIAAESRGDTPIRVLLAEDFNTDITAGLNIQAAETIDLIVAERHPLLSMDEALLKRAEGLPCRCHVTCHLSLEDELLKRFMGGSVEKILQSLGMKKDEPIESTMVSRRVQGAQREIEENVFGRIRARSAAEWFELNLPNS